MAKTQRVNDLAKAVTRAFQSAGFGPDTLLKGQIVHTDLLWQVPPLRTQATLAGLPLTSYLDYPIKANAEAFYDFYCEGLAALGQNPALAIGSAGWRGLSKCLSTASSGEKLARFSIPEGFPEDMDPFAGHRFAVEAAHFAKSSMVISAHVETANDFWCDTAFGRIGVVEGLPTAYADLWDLNCEGLLDEMLTAPRGLRSTACHYDILAKARSVIYENVDKFVEFEGIDLALQALRVLTDGRLCTELLQGIEGMSRAAFFRKRKITILGECIDIMEQWSLNDRTKISMLFERLVPEVLNMADYQRRIIDPYKVLPAVLTLKTEARIINSLKYLKEKLQHAN